MLIKIKNRLNYFYQQSTSGAVALILVIMITALTIVSAVVISMVNTSDLMSSYSFSEDEKTSVDVDACLEDALFRLASSTTASGTYYLNGAGVNCYYKISSSISGGLKIVTSTASSTSDIGYWEDAVVVQVNVSSTPISVYSYKSFDMSYAPIVEGGCTATCGNSSVECDEVCDDGNTTTEYCGNGSTDVGKCNATCTATVASETCDDGNTNTEACGDGVKQTGGAIYCNSNCTSVVTRNEACDYTGSEALPDDPGCYFGSVGCGVRSNGCRNSCGSCTICMIAA